MSYLIIMIDQSRLFTNVADVIYNIMNIGSVIDVSQ